MWIMTISIGKEVVSTLYFPGLEEAIAAAVSNHYGDNETVSICSLL